MAKPLATNSLQDFDGLGQFKIEPQNEDASTESAADDTVRKIQALLDESDTVPEIGQTPTEHSQLEASTDDDGDAEVADEDDEEAVRSFVNRVLGKIEIDDEIEPEPVDAVQDEEDRKRETEIASRASQPLNLTPRPTGSATTIAQMREVANLTVQDAFKSFRCKQRISNAYVALAASCVCILSALVCSCFDVNEPGLARLVSWASTGLGILAVASFTLLISSVNKQAM